MHRHTLARTVRRKLNRLPIDCMEQQQDQVGSSISAVLQCAIGEIDVGYKDGTQSQVTLRLIPESCVVNSSTKVFWLFLIIYCSPFSKFSVLKCNLQVGINCSSHKSTLKIMQACPSTIVCIIIGGDNGENKQLFWRK